MSIIVTYHGCTKMDEKKQVEIPKGEWVKIDRSSPIRLLGELEGQCPSKKIFLLREVFQVAALAIITDSRAWKAGDPRVSSLTIVKAGTEDGKELIKDLAVDIIARGVARFGSSTLFRGKCIVSNHELSNNLPTAR
jgi:hypothetical protein